MDKIKNRIAVNVNKCVQQKRKECYEGTSELDSPSIALDEWVYVSEKPKTNQMAEDSDQEGATWLDDLNVDKQCSGVGFSYNQVYKDDGYKHEYHTFEDKCFRIRISDDCFLYGVFDGHCGIRAAEFVSQRLPAEIVLGQLSNVKTDADVQNVLQQAYRTVEKAYFSSLDNLIAERTSLQQDLLESQSLALKAKTAERLRVVDEQLSSGTSALVALILKNQLYVANVGNSRALLCSTESGKLRVSLLNDDHTLENECEVQRLADLGLPIETIRNSKKFGQQLYTRCIGDYSVKGGYRDNEQMSAASSEPVIAEPDLEEPICIDSTCNFLLLMTDGVYRSLVDATDTTHVNADIAGMVASEFTRQSTLNGVSQAVIDRITRKHHDAYALAQPGDPIQAKCSLRDDMTLLIVNFNYRLRTQSLDMTSSAQTSSSSLTQSMASSADDLTPTDTSSSSKQSECCNPFKSQPTQSFLDAYMDSGSESIVDSLKSNASMTGLELDKDGRLEPYVSFEDFHAALAAMTEEERKEFELRLVPKMDCETIMEQPEG
ncbi:TGF-beta-activated kinase 1 and MAP3K7-binding protein 1-like [Watersipora subatra]|uniref:TGF-beta-activated kinase 1 and MAP3K7-binding protein 1-like n=1 Tax=Watersipora subatra TaxID=2589382 RepID=UPI00355C5EB2